MNTTQLPIRASYLKALSRSPAHCLQAMRDDMEGALHRDRHPEDGTPAKERGSALHAVLFGTARVVVPPEGLKKPTSAQRNAKKSTPASVVQIAQWDAFMAEHAASYILTPAKFNEVQRMADAVRDNPIACEVLGLRDRASVQTEQTIRFDYCGRACRATPDVIGADRIVDLKSTRDGSTGGFPWQSKRFGYHVQMAFYLQAAKREHVYVVTVEAARPYPVTVYKMTDRALEMGERIVRLNMERLLACEQSNEWPQYAQSIVELDLPGEDDFELQWGDEEADEADAAE